MRDEISDEDITLELTPGFRVSLFSNRVFPGRQFNPVATNNIRVNHEANVVINVTLKDMSHVVRTEIKVAVGIPL